MDELNSAKKSSYLNVTDIRNQSLVIFVSMLNVLSGIDLLLNNHLPIFRENLSTSIVMISAILIFTGSIYFSLIFINRRRTSYDIILSLTGIMSFITWIYYLSIYTCLSNTYPMMLVLLVITGYNLILSFIGGLSLWQKTSKMR